MCFIEKMNCIRICKRYDCVSNPVCTPGWVGSGQVLGRELLINAFGYLYKEHRKEIRLLMEKRDKEMEGTLNYRENCWT